MVSIAIQDLPAEVDVVFEELPDRSVLVAGNRHGRGCVAALFPGARIAWQDRRPHAALPADWRSTVLESSDIVGHMDVPERLAAEITDVSTVEHLGALLAAASIEQGARVAIMVAPDKATIIVKASVH